MPAATPGSTDTAARQACPRCGSTRLHQHTIMYADGPVPAYVCQECSYLDLQRLPTYISPKVTTKVDERTRKLAQGPVLEITRQAGVMDDESATGALPAAGPEHV